MEIINSFKKKYEDNPIKAIILALIAALSILLAFVALVAELYYFRWVILFVIVTISYAIYKNHKYKKQQEVAKKQEFSELVESTMKIIFDELIPIRDRLCLPKTDNSGFTKIYHKLISGSNVFVLAFAMLPAEENPTIQDLRAYRNILNTSTWRGYCRLK